MASNAAANGGIPSSSAMATVGSASSADHTASFPAASSTNPAIAPGSAASTTSAPVFKKENHVALWNIDWPGIDAWIGTIPGPFQSNGTTAAASAGGDDKTKDGSVVPNMATSSTNSGTYDHAIFYRKAQVAF